jgi:hypothetical protein
MIKFDLKLLVPATAGVLLSFSGAADRVAFAPEKGLTLKRTVENRMTMDLEDMTLDLDGQDMTAMMGGLPEMSFTTTMNVVVSDEYVEVAEGRPAKLKRTFDTIGANTVVDVSMAGEGESNETPTTSDLEGGTVLFTWDEEKGEFVASWANEGETRDAELLEGLEEDMDLRAFIPGRDLEPGESWDIDPIALGALLFPGGDLGMKGEEAEDMEMDMSQFEDMFTEMLTQYEDALAGLLDGERKATYEGMREVDGRTLAVISFKIDTDGSMDMSSMIADAIDKIGEITEMPAEVDMQIGAANLTMAFDGTGQLLWNPRRGTFESLTIEVDMTMGMELSMDIDAQGEAHSVDMTMEMAGDMASNYAAE